MKASDPKLLEEAERRYWTDVDFNAKVKTVVHVAIEQRGVRPRPNRDAEGFARACVSVALILGEAGE